MTDHGPQKIVSKADDVPVIRVSYQRPLAESGALVFETYLAQDAPLAKVNEIMDKLALAGDRQNTRADIDRLERLVANDQAEYERLLDALDDLDRVYASKAAVHNAAKRTPFKLSEQEEKAREGYVRNLDMLKKKIQQVRDRIDLLRDGISDMREAAE